jgi:hypothetical protein
MIAALSAKKQSSPIFGVNPLTDLIIAISYLKFLFLVANLMQDFQIKAPRYGVFHYFCEI